MKKITTLIALFLNVSGCIAVSSDSTYKQDQNIKLTKHFELNEINIEPNASTYSLPLDLNDIVNSNQVNQVIDINSALNLIQENGFAIVEPGIYSDLSCHDFDTFYMMLKQFRIPALFTIDSVLYLYYNLLNEALKDIEDTSLRTRIFDLKKQPFEVGEYGNGAYVRGLDLMALLGSNEALNILAEEGDKEYEAYESQFGWLNGDFDAMDHTQLNDNLYWYWLYSIHVLFQKKSEEYPRFMHTHAWNRHLLHSALASWTQLHDDIIRRPDPTEPTFPGVPIGVSIPPRPLPTPPLGCVEPIPSFWKRLLSLTLVTSKRLDNLGVLTPETRGRFSLLEELIDKSIDITNRQLSGAPPSSEDYEFFEQLISISGKILPGAPEHGLANIFAGDKMLIEQAVGDIDLIILACPISDCNVQLAIGPVLSYYEFNQPDSSFLNEEKWRLILDSPTKPDRPQWYSPLFRPREDFLKLTRLTNNLLPEGTACWSPDGKKIVFAGSEKEWTSDIYVMNPDGTDKKNLTNNPGIYASPRWSPDGKKIVFQFYVRSRGQIYLMNTDGTEHKRLTNNNAHDAGPCWSPDGKRIVFWSDRTGGDIYIMNADGTEQKRLTYNPASDIYPCWSPDGKQIVFASDRNDRRVNYEIYVINIDGSEAKRLTNIPGNDRSPCWSPDGGKIAFVSDRDGNNEIYVMNADGSEQRRLTNNSAKDDNPCWSPDGRQIILDSWIGIRGFPEICILDYSQN